MTTGTALVPYQAVKFGDAGIEIYDQTDSRWIVANQVADAIGQARRAFRKLCSELTEKNELLEVRHFKYLTLDTGSGMKATLVLSYLGVIRVMMRSNAPKAQQFRDWAETVLLEVMLTGQYKSQIIQVTKSDLLEIMSSMQRQPTDLEIQQGIYHKNIITHTDLYLRNPELAWRHANAIEDEITNWNALTRGPRIGITRITPDLFAEYWVDKAQSRLVP
jgi:prophage antirepressor-like protein